MHQSVPLSPLRDFTSILKSEGTNLLSESNASQFILFTDIGPQAFARDFEHPVRDIICHIIDSYCPLQGALVVKMKTGAHEAAHVTFNNRLIRKLVFMDSADECLEGIGSKTVSSTSRSKEADLAYRPLELPQGRSKEWPTFTLESGYSNSKDVLKNNAKWWISASGHNVKVAVIIDIHEQRKETTSEPIGSRMMELLASSSSPCQRTRVEVPMLIVLPWSYHSMTCFSGTRLATKRTLNLTIAICVVLERLFGMNSSDRPGSFALRTAGCQ